MKKIVGPIFSLILLIFINGCAGYEPIFGSKNLQFEEAALLRDKIKELQKNENIKLL